MTIEPPLVISFQETAYSQANFHWNAAPFLKRRSSERELSKESAAKTADLLSMPTEILFEIMNYLAVKDQINLLSTNRRLQAIACEALIARAKKYGYPLENCALNAAAPFLSSLFKTAQIVAMNYLKTCTAKCIRRTTLDLFFFTLTINLRKCNTEQTLLNISNVPIDRLTSLYTNSKFIDIDSTEEFTRFILKTRSFKSDEELFFLNQVLIYATKKGQLEVMQRLLSLGADPNTRNHEGKTPLFIAMESNCRNECIMQIVALLLDHKADPNIPANNGFTPLTAVTAFPEITELLLLHGAHPNYQVAAGGNTALHFAAIKGQVETMRVLLSLGADPNLGNFKHKTPLHIAVTSMYTNVKRRDVAALLLDHKAHPNLIDSSGSTPLIISTSLIVAEWSEINQLILRHGAGPYFFSPYLYHFVPLSWKIHFAREIKRGQIETLHVLLARGADPAVADHNGSTPLSIAANYPKIFEILIDH